jgi:DNA repair exonuclease SbcCD ATPase subunit
MFFASIRLLNIRCFKDVFVDFDLPGGKNRKWTILTGENGSGKSTILKSIALVMAGSDALAELVGNPDEWISQGATEGKIIAEIETAKGAKRELVLRIVRGEGLSKFLARSSETLSLLNDALEHTTRNYLTIGYGASRRLTQAGFSDQSNSSRGHVRARSMHSCLCLCDTAC